MRNILILFILSLTSIAFTSNRPVKIRHKFDKNEMDISWGTRYFIHDLDDDGIGEFIIQSKRVFRVYRIDIPDREIALIQEFSIPDSNEFKGDAFYSHGNPGGKFEYAIVFIVNSGVYAFPLANGKFSEEPVKIHGPPPGMKFDKEGADLDYAEICLDFNGDGKEDVLVPTTKGIQLLSWENDKVRNISLGAPFQENIPTFITDSPIEANLKKLRDNLRFLKRRDDAGFDLLRTRTGIWSKNKKCEIYRLNSKGEYSETPDQTFHLPRKSYPFFYDFNLDGDYDMLDVDLERHSMNFRSNIRITYSGPSDSEPFTQTFVNRDPSGLALPADHNGDGFNDLLMLSLNINMGSVDDIVKYMVGEKVEIILQIHYFDPKEKQFEMLPGTHISCDIQNKVGIDINNQGDFNGDGMYDILLRTGEDECRIYSLNKNGVNKDAYAELEINEDYYFSGEYIDSGPEHDLVFVSHKHNSAVFYIFQNDE